jgi:hypothetical protein
LVTNNGGVSTTSLRLQTNLCPIVEAVPRTLGQKTMDKSLAVVLPSDQVVSVSVSGVPAGATGGIRFGTALISNATPVAVRATTYTEQTVGAQRSLKSTSASDTNAAGTGARKVKITYDQDDVTGPFTETVNLNGTTAVTTTATDICFIEMMEVTEVGSTGANVGTISLYVNTLGTLTIIGSIGVSSLAVGGDNQTFWAHHYVPVGKTMHILLVSFGTTGNQIGTAILDQKNPLVATDPEKQILDYLDVGAANNGSTSVFRTPASAIDIVGPARVVLYGISQGTNTMFQGGIEFYEV